MRILICGDRGWEDDISVLTTVLLFKSKYDLLEIIEGGARGADAAGKLAANKLNLVLHSFPAEWKKYGYRAGPIRNRQMLQKGKPNLVIGFHDNIVKSKGTLDMLNISVEKGIPTILMFHSRDEFMKVDYKWWSNPPQEDLLPWNKEEDEPKQIK